MGLLDDVMSKAAPGGSISKPAMIALGALLVGKMMSGGGASAQTAAAPVPDAADADTPEGGLLGGLGGLLQKLQSAGHGDTVNSWVGSGQNQPIDPGQLGSALGPNTVQNLAQQAGINPQDLLSQMAQHLPGLVDQLTANGRMPDLQDLASILSKK